MATIIYIDGFNVFYGALKGTTYKWLDYEALCRRLLPEDDIVKIRYFTARVSARGSDEKQPARQEIYLRALRTLPLLEIHFGHFVRRRVRMPLVNPPAFGSKTAEVFKTEEKGSDVNLATYLLLDASQKKCDTAVVVSNDSDLAEPIRVAQLYMDVTVGIVNPHAAPHRSTLMKGTFFKQLRPNVLAQVQFPEQFNDAHGVIRKPSSW